MTWARSDTTRAHPDAHERGDDGQEHGEHGAEGQQQDDGCRGEPDQLAAAELGWGLEDLAAELDLQPVGVGVGRQGAELLERVLGDLLEVALELHLGEPDLAVGRDLALAAGGEGGPDLGDVVDGGRLLEQCRELGLGGGVVEAGVGLEHDLAWMRRCGPGTDP